MALYNGLWEASQKLGSRGKRETGARHYKGLLPFRKSFCDELFTGEGRGDVVGACAKLLVKGVEGEAVVAD